MGSNSGQTETVKATETAFTLLEGLAEVGGAARVVDLADHHSMPKSTVYKHLATLRSLGYVQQRDGRYVLGTGLADLGEHARARDDLYPIVKSHVDRLAETTGESAGFTVERDGAVLDLYCTGDGPDALAHSNSRYPHCSAPGKAILSRLPSDRIEAIIDEHGLPERTDATITDRDRFTTELDRTRERGIAFERAEQYQDVRSVAVPIIDDDAVVGAIYAAGPTERLSSKRFEESIPGIILSTVDTLQDEL